MMKSFKKMVGILLAAVMCLGMCLTAFAAEGECSITVENSIGGVTYSIYKVFDATYSVDESTGETTNVSYTIESSSPWYALVNPDENVDSPFALTQVGDTTTYVVTVADSVTETDIAEFFNDLTAEQLATVQKAADDKTGTGGSIKWTDLDAGYYLIVPASDKYTSVAVSVDTAAPDAVVVDKNQYPTLDKEVDSDNYSIGDHASYTITAYVPTYVGEDEIASYTFTDVMAAGLSYDEGSISITVTGTGVEESNPITLDPDADYCTVEYDSDTNTLTISYNILDENGDLLIEGYPADAEITITYTATVTEKADDADINNKVTLTWTTVDNEEPENPPEDETHSYTFGFDLEKISGYDEENPIKLDGAEFTLQAEGSEGLIQFVYDETSNTYEVYDGIEGGVESVTTTTTIAVGEANIWGLSEGTYVLTETKAPDGYNMLADPITFTITEITDDDGNPTGWTVSIGDVVYGTGTFDSSDEHGVMATSIPLLTVLNNAGTLLPGTGGMGTTIFYIAGVLLIICAAAALIAKRRLDRQN